MKKLTFIVLMILAFSQQMYAQACSDPGLSYVGWMGPNHASHVPEKNQFILNQEYAIGEANVTMLSYSLEYRRSVNKGYLQVRMPYAIIEGTLGSNHGWGDLMASYNHLFLEKNQWQLAGTIGARIATDRGDQQVEDKHLPMSYQSSLGTHDMILGLNARNNGWSFSLGYQHPFNATKNRFIQEQWSADLPAEDYQNSYRIRKADDIMLRFEKHFQLRKWDLYVGMVDFYRVKEDQIQQEGVYQDIEGSKGHTLNLTTGAQYHWGNHKELHFSYGMPLVARMVHADGTLRQRVLNLGFHFAF